MSIAIAIDPPIALGNYTLLQAHIAEKMDRDDLAAQIPNFIRMAEFWLSDKIFHPLGEASATLITVPGSETLSLPTDFRQLRHAYVAGAQAQPLQQVSPSSLREEWPNASGMPQAFAIAAGTLQLAPVPDGAYNIVLGYLGALTPLSDSNPSNWLLARRADVYVYAALLQAEAHIVNDGRLPLWKAALDEALADLNAAGNRYRVAASPYRLRNPVCV